MNDQLKTKTIRCIQDSLMTLNVTVYDSVIYQPYQKISSTEDSGMAE